jgi:hypothetical protein
MLLKDINKLASKLNNLPKVSRGLDELFQDHVAHALMSILYHNGIKGVGAYLDDMRYTDLTLIDISVRNYSVYHELSMCMMRESWGFLLRMTTNLETGKVEVYWRSVA